MEKLLLVLVLGAAIVASTAATALADRDVTLRSRKIILHPVEGTAPTEIGSGNLNGTACQIGNLNPAAWAISGFIAPPEDYKLVFDPGTTCSVCPTGFQVTTISIHLQTDTTCTFVMSVDLERAVLESPGCYAPGPVLCATGLYQVDIPSAGGWIIGLPVSVDDCQECPEYGCFSMTDGPYCLSVHFESMSVPSSHVDLVTDAGPAVNCLNWNNYGTGWYDLLGAYPTWPGQLKIFADATCCGTPSSVENDSWGCIKAVYR